MKEDFNIGLAILRAIMCFMVILCHCWDASNAQSIMKFFLWARKFAVPVFMMMSFILGYNSLVEHNKGKMKKRFERLIIPQFGWTIIYWAVYRMADLIHRGGELRITDMLWQMFSGSSPKLNGTMWFQVDLICLTCLFLAVIIIFKRNYIFVFMVLGIMFLFIQYSGVNMIFDSWRWELKYPIGRFSEMCPIAVAGFTISFFNLLEKMKKNRFLIGVLSIYIIFLDAGYGIFSEVTGYGYSGVRMLVISFVFVTLFYVIPFEKIVCKTYKIVRTLTSHTMGIYCMHRLIAYIFNSIISKFNLEMITNTFSECIIIYILCFLLSYVGTLLFGKTKLKVLFD